MRSTSLLLGSFLIAASPAFAGDYEPKFCPTFDGCLSLAEAHDRGFVNIGTGERAATIVIENLSDKEICLDTWYVGISPDSQDAALGNDPANTTLAAGETREFSYGSWTTANGTYEGRLGESAWWCVEKGQSTTPNQPYAFNGAQLPPPLQAIIEEQRDDNLNGVEDHVDWIDSNGVQTNHSIWEYQLNNPVLIIGRDQNYAEIGLGESTEITLQISNIGELDGNGLITETLAPGLVASNFSQAPISITMLADGSTQYQFESGSIAGRELATDHGGFDYAQLNIQYTLTNTNAACDGRIESENASIDWQDASNAHHTSLSSEFIVACCEHDASPTMSGDGFTPGFWKNNFKKAAMGKKKGIQVSATELSALMEQINNFFITTAEHGDSAPFQITSFAHAASIMNPTDSSDAAQKLARHLLASELNYFYGARLDNEEAHLAILKRAETLLLHADTASRSEMLEVGAMLDEMNNL